jgi:hypothetical protein
MNMTSVSNQLIAEWRVALRGLPSPLARWKPLRSLAKSACARAGEHPGGAARLRYQSLARDAACDGGGSVPTASAVPGTSDPSLPQV